MKDVENNEVIVKSQSLKLQIKEAWQNKKIKITFVDAMKILFIILVGILIIKGILYLLDPARKVPDYSIVYVREDGDLMVTTKDARTTTKIASNTDSVVRYANSTNRYILYTKKDNLYLFDQNKGNKTKKIASKVSNIFGFSKDDKYYYYIDEDNKLYTYKNKEIKIDSDVEFIYGVSKKYIIYQKGKAIYYSKLDGKKQKELVSDAKAQNLSDDGNKMTYIDEDNKLYIITFGGKKEKIDENVSKILKISKNFKTIVYATEDDDIYVYHKGKTKKYVTEASSLYYVSADDLEFVYTKDNTLYYQKKDNKAIEITEDENITKAYLYKSELYFTILNDNEYTLYYAKLGGKKASEPKKVLSNVDDNAISGYKKGLVVISSRDGLRADLNIVKGGKAKEIGSDVLISSITYSHNKKTLYYLDDYDNDAREGRLRKFTGRKAKTMVNNVYNYNYIKDDIIYTQVNYNSKNKTTDLKVIYKGKIKDIADDITKMYDVPVVVK